MSTMENQANETSQSLNIKSLYDVVVDVSVVLGSTKLLLNDLLKLNKGAVIELDKMIGEPVDIHVNGKPVAKGEIVVVDNKIGVTLTEIIKTE